MIDVGSMGLQALSKGSSFLSAHWSTVKPVLDGTVTAIGAVIVAMGVYKTSVIAMNTIKGIAAVVEALYTAAVARTAVATAAQATATSVATGTIAASITAAYAQRAATAAQTAATNAATASQLGLNFALLSNHIFLLVAAVIVVIGVLTALHIKNNGLKASILQVQNVALTAWDMMKVAAAGGSYIIITTWNAIKIQAMSTANTVVTNWEYMRLGIGSAKNGILNFIGDMKVKGLMLFQDFLNGSIDLINRFVENVNGIAGTSFELINHVTMGTDAAVNEKAVQSVRNAEFNNEKRDSAAMLAEKERKLNAFKIEAAQEAADLKNKQGIMFSEATDKAAARQRAIDDAIKEHKAGKSSIEDLLKFDQNASGMMNGTFDEEALENIGKTAENTSRMADNMTYSDNVLSLLRASAERNYFDKTVTIKVDMVNNNSINSALDIDGIIGNLATGLEEKMAVMAEGGHI